jgi:hypothetical protein
MYKLLSTISHSLSLIFLFLFLFLSLSLSSFLHPFCILFFPFCHFRETQWKGPLTPLSPSSHKKELRGDKKKVWWGMKYYEFLSFRVISNDENNFSNINHFFMLKKRHLKVCFSLNFIWGVTCCLSETIWCERGSFFLRLSRNKRRKSLKKKNWSDGENKVKKSLLINR